MKFACIAPYNIVPFWTTSPFTPYRIPKVPTTDSLATIPVNIATVARQSVNPIGLNIGKTNFPIEPNKLNPISDSLNNLNLPSTNPK